MLSKLLNRLKAIEMSSTLNIHKSNKFLPADKRRLRLRCKSKGKWLPHLEFSPK